MKRKLLYAGLILAWLVVFAAGISFFIYFNNKNSEYATIRGQATEGLYRISDTEFKSGGTLSIYNANDELITTIEIDKEMIKGKFDPTEGTHYATIEYSGIKGTYKYTVLSDKIVGTLLEGSLKQVYDSLDSFFEYSYGANLVIMYESGNIKKIPLDRVTFNPFYNYIGMNTGYITYDNVVFNFSYEVREWIPEHIKIHKYPKQEYKDTDFDFDLTGSKILAYDTSTQKQQVIEISSPMLSKFNNSIGTHIATITYKGRVCTFEYTVVADEQVSFIYFENYPKQNYYSDAVEFDMSNVTIVIHFKNNTEKIVPVTLITFEISSFDNTAGSHTATFTFNGKTITFNYVVTQVEIIAISIYTNPVLVYYDTDTKFDLTGAQIQVDYNNGLIEYVDITESMVEGFNNIVGSHTVKVTYKTFICLFTYTVEREIDFISMQTTTTPTYTVEDTEFNLQEYIILITYKDGTVSLKYIEDSMLSEFDNSVGTHIAIVTYKDKTCTFEYIVNEIIVVVNIKVKTITTRYITKDIFFNLDNAIIIVEYSNNTTEEIPVTQYMISNFDNSLGIHIAIITYQGKTCTFEYEVLDNFVIGISIYVYPQSEYWTSDIDFEIGSAQLLVDYEDGTSEYIQITPSMIITLFDNTAGIHTAIIEFEGFTVEFIYVVNAVYTTGLELNLAPKTDYWTTDSEFDLSGGSIKVWKSDGSYEIIDMDGLEISEFDNSEGSHSATIWYDDYSYSFDYNVSVPTIVAIDVINPPVTEYISLDTAFDITGGLIHVIYSDGARVQMNITIDMLSAFDSTAGQHEATVTYSGFTDVFTYNVTQVYTVTIHSDGIDILVKDNIGYFKLGETVELEIADSEDYLISSLFYVRGTYIGAATPSNDKTIIYNNRFSMPNSSVTVVCETTLKTQTVTVTNVVLSADPDYLANTQLLSVRFYMENNGVKSSHEHTDATINSGAFIGSLDYNITQELTTFTIKNHSIEKTSLNLSVSFIDSSVYKLISVKKGSDSSDKFSNKIYLDDSGKYLLKHNMWFEFEVEDKMFNTTTTVWMELTVTVSFIVTNQYSVTFITEDEQIDRQVVTQNAQVTNPGGTWYTDEERTQVWDFTSGVTEDLILYKG